MGAMRAAPLTTNWGNMGTAFDYLARFQIQRRFAKAQDKYWVAEAAIQRVCLAKFRIVATYKDLLPGGAFHDVVTEAKDPRWGAFVLHGSMMLDAARKQHSQFLANGANLTDVAKSCLDLAYIDNVFRAGERGLPRQLPWSIHPDDVQDLVNLHAALPQDFPGPYQAVNLNPTFGQWSRNIGGADADIIADDVLIDIKTTKNLEITDKFWHQLLGYAILDELNSRDEGTPPTINKVAIYFSRHGGFWAKDLTPLRKQPMWQQLVTYFEERLS